MAFPGLSNLLAKALRVNFPAVQDYTLISAVGRPADGRFGAFWGVLWQKKR
jgi:hypothetical protein